MASMRTLPSSASLDPETSLAHPRLGSMLQLRTRIVVATVGLAAALCGCGMPQDGASASSSSSSSSAADPSGVRSPLLDLPTLFTDHLVLQRGMPVPIWGTTAPHGIVDVSFRDQHVTVTADDEGRWVAHLSPLEAGGPFELEVKTAKSVTLHDVMVGEVWLASGQSNMSFQLSRTDDAAQAIAASANPALRMFTVSHDVSDTPERDVGGRWDVSSPETSPAFSAVAYHTARELQEKLQVPVGVIHSSWPGTPIEAWMGHAWLTSDPSFQSIFDAWAAKVKENAAAITAYEPMWLAWRHEADAAKAMHKPFPEQPEGLDAPEGPRHPYYPSNTYNAMIAPVTPYALRGFLWYQGEANRDRAAQYAKLFPVMINGFRALWGEKDAPFLFVQLAGYGPTPAEPAESSSAELREAQTSALALPKTAMAVTIDIGNSQDVHPKNKRDVGHRLALAARSVAYGEKLVYSGPLYDNVTVEGSALRVHFQWVGGGLVAKGGSSLTGFAIAGADGRFVWANASIEGASVVVKSSGVPAPKSVRYAWGNSPICNLFNAEGLPASPFRASLP
jgi:sialate O-acetylesterase